MNLVLLTLSAFTSAQTYSLCNPLEQYCDPVPALGRKLAVDFVQSGPSSSFQRTGSATITYDTSQGALFSISGSGHNPTLQSKFYIMFGKVVVRAKASPGAGIVSSILLQSDDLDEIDIEFVGNDPGQFQTNYFSKGDTSTYDRGKYHSIPGGTGTSDLHDYTIEWTSNHVKWYVDDQLVRSLTSADHSDSFPQTPMNVRVGSWAAGDISNGQGTIDWAGGLIDYGEGPFIYNIQSISVEDYSTGSNYEYTDRTGTWQSIKAHNGAVGAEGPMNAGWFKNFAKIATPM